MILLYFDLFVMLLLIYFHYKLFIIVNSYRNTLIEISGLDRIAIQYYYYYYYLAFSLRLLILYFFL